MIIGTGEGGGDAWSVLPRNASLMGGCLVFTLSIFYSRNGGSETQTLLSYRSFNQVTESQFVIQPRCDVNTKEIIIKAGSVLPVAILCKARYVSTRMKVRYLNLQ